jgi:hypothetical protein
VGRRLTGRLLLVAGVIGSGLAGMSAGQAVTYEDRLPAVLATAILGTITLACLGGARISCAAVAGQACRHWTGSRGPMPAGYRSKRGRSCRMSSRAGPGWVRVRRPQR